MRDSWNFLDFFIALISLFDFIFTYSGAVNLPSIKGFRTFRVLKPLRTIKRVPKMKRIVDNLLRSLGELTNTLVFMFFFIMVFSIMGIQTFHGATY